MNKMRPQEAVPQLLMGLQPPEPPSAPYRLPCLLVHGLCPFRVLEYKNSLQRNRPHRILPGLCEHWGKHFQILWYTPSSVSQQIFTGAGKVTEEQQQQQKPFKYVCHTSSGQLSTAPNRFLKSSPAPNESQENLSALRAAPG